MAELVTLLLVWMRRLASSTRTFRLPACVGMCLLASAEVGRNQYARIGVYAKQKSMLAGQQPLQASLEEAFTQGLLDADLAASRAASKWSYVVKIEAKKAMAKVAARHEEERQAAAARKAEAEALAAASKEAAGAAGDCVAAAAAAWRDAAQATYLAARECLSALEVKVKDALDAKVQKSMQVAKLPWYEYTSSLRGKIVPDSWLSLLKAWSCVCICDTQCCCATDESLPEELPDALQGFLCALPSAWDAVMVLVARREFMNSPLIRDVTGG